MDPLFVLAIQCCFSILTFALLAHWYLYRIAAQRRWDVLAFLLILNVFRYLPLSLYMPGQVSADFPEVVKHTVAFGDLISSVLALTALIALKTKSRLTISFIWIFSVVSILDMILALSFAMMGKVYDLPLGANYFTVSVYVPLLIVSQTFIIKALITKKTI